MDNNAFERLLNSDKIIDKDSIDHWIRTISLERGDTSVYQTIKDLISYLEASSDTLTLYETEQFDPMLVAGANIDPNSSGGERFKQYLLNILKSLLHEQELQ